MAHKGYHLSPISWGPLWCYRRSLSFSSSDSREVVRACARCASGTRLRMESCKSCDTRQQIEYLIPFHWLVTSMLRPRTSSSLWVKKKNRVQVYGKGKMNGEGERWIELWKYLPFLLISKPDVCNCWHSLFIDGKAKKEINSTTYYSGIIIMNSCSLTVWILSIQGEIASSRSEPATTAPDGQSLTN